MNSVWVVGKGCVDMCSVLACGLALVMPEELAARHFALVDTCLEVLGVKPERGAAASCSDSRLR